MIVYCSVNIHICIQTYLFVYIHTTIFIYIYTHIYIYIYTRMPLQEAERNLAIMDDNFSVARAKLKSVSNYAQNVCVCVCMCACVSVCVRVSVCVCERERE